MYGTYQRLHVSVHASNRAAFEGCALQAPSSCSGYKASYREGRHLFYRNMHEDGMLKRVHTQTRRVTK